MSKHWQVFIIWGLATFLFVLVNPFTYSHLNALPNQTGNDPIFCKHERAVCLDDRFIFWIENKEKVGYFTPAKRADEIENRIQKIADDSSIDIDDLIVDPLPRANITTVRSPEIVIFTLSNKDITEAKPNIKDREKLASQYLEKIKNVVKYYRKRRQSNHFFGWFKENIWSNNILQLILAFLLAITIIIVSTLVDRFIIQKYPRSHKLINSVVRFLINSFGILIEIIVFLISIVLISRLILITFLINREAFVVDNLTKIDFEIKTLFEQSLDILQVIGLILLFGILSLLLHWLSRKGQGTVIIPFEDTTGGKYNGKAIADLLAEELHRIHQIHLLSTKFASEYDVKLESINLSPIAPKENIENHLADSGIVDIKIANFSPGKLLVTLRYLWPFGGVSRVISGSIHELESQSNLVGINSTKISLIMRLDEPSEVGIWKATSEGKLTESLSTLIRDMAYKISLKLAINITAKNWKSFKFFTEGINNFYEYKSTQSIDLLRKAEQNCIAAKKFDLHYDKISDLFYALGVEYFKKFYQDHEGQEKAKRMFNLAIEVNNKNACAHNGMGNIYGKEGDYFSAIQEYRRAIELDKKFAYPHNGLGISYKKQGRLEMAEAEYRKAIKLKPTLWQAHHNLGNLYGRMRRYDNAIKEFRNALNIDVDCQGNLGLGWNILRKVVNEKKSWNKNDLENKRIKNQLSKAQNEMQSGLNSEKHKDRKYGYLINLGVISLWLGKKEEARKHLDRALQLTSDGNQYEINKKYTTYVEFYTYVRYAISSEISEPDLKSKIKSFKNYIDSSDLALQKGLLLDVLQDVDVLARLPTEYQPKKIDEIVSMLKESLSNNVPIIWLLLREINCIAGILFLREYFYVSPLNLS